MPLHSSESLIIKQIDFHENDKIITFLTKDQGKKSGLLKGSKRIKSQHVGLSEPFMYVNLLYLEKVTAELVQIRKIDLLDSFYPIRQNYDKILYATYFTELIHLCVIDPVEAARFFDLLLATLQNLQKISSYTQIKIHFEKTLLEYLGIDPNLEFCCQCHRSLWKDASNSLSQLWQMAPHQLDCAEGGIRCPECEVLLAATTISLSPGTLSYLRSISQHSLSEIKVRATRQNGEEWSTAFLAYFQYYFGKNPKSHAFLKSLPTSS